MTETIRLDSKNRRCLTASAAARRKGVTRQAIVDAVARGALPGERRGTELLVPLRHLDRFEADPTKQRAGRARR